MPSGSLAFGAAATSMATAAGGLSLVERGRLRSLRWEDKASWRRGSPHPPSPAGGPAPWSRSGVKGAGPLPGDASPRAAGSLQPRTSDSCGSGLLDALWPGVEGKLEKPSHFPRESFPRVGGSFPPPRRSPGRVEGGGALPAAGSPPLQRLAEDSSAGEELDPGCGETQAQSRTANRSLRDAARCGFGQRKGRRTDVVRIYFEFTDNKAHSLFCLGLSPFGFPLPP